MRKMRQAAIFSNGHTDTYKGKRDVRAPIPTKKEAWRRARSVVEAAMKARGANILFDHPTKAESDNGKRELARLLLHIEYDEGGLLGASDRQKCERAESLQIPLEFIPHFHERGAWLAKEAA